MDFWMQLAQTRIKWRALTLTMLKLLIPYWELFSYLVSLFVGSLDI